MCDCVHHFLNGFLDDRKMRKKTFFPLQIADHVGSVGEQNKKKSVCVNVAQQTNLNSWETLQQNLLKNGPAKWWKNEAGEAIEENCFCAPHCSVFVSSSRQLVNTKEGFVEVGRKGGK